MSIVSLPNDPKKRIEEEKQEFEQVADVVLSDDAQDTQEAPDWAKYITSLGSTLTGLFTEAEGYRRSVEDRWLKDLRQYRGEYDSETKARMNPKRSQAFLRLTRTKVKTVDARLMDLLFPINGDKNWGIQPTPVPELTFTDKETLKKEMLEVTGEVVGDDEIDNLLENEARQRSEAMEQEIADQLAELRYRDTIRKVLHSGNLYGTGILKGPLVKEKKVKRWVEKPDGGSWYTFESRKITPYVEFVSVWDVYPDLTANNPDDARYIWQRYVMPKHKLLALAARDDFNGEAIKAYVRSAPDGNATYKNFEADLTTTKPNTEASHKSYRTENYEVLEFWGYRTVQELRDAGVDVDDSIDDIEVACNIWLLDGMIIKAVISPLEGATFPYFFYYFDEDETSIFGEGIPSVMRDPQALFNASVRAMLDNAAIAAGPIIEANVSLLTPGDDPTDIFPFRVFTRDGEGADAQYPAIRVTNVSSYTRDFLSMAEFFLQQADESTTIPRYLQGETQAMGAAGKTATGLSMLMGAANIVLKDQIKHFDDGITKPFIKSLYYWNMDFNSKEEIKGDYDVVAKGSTSLVAKEVQMEKILQFIAMTSNPYDMEITNRDRMLTEVAKKMDLDDYGFIKTPAEMRLIDAQKAELAKQERAQQYELERLKAESGGHVGNDQESGVHNPNQRPTLERVPREDLEQGVIPNVGY